MSTIKPFSRAGGYTVFENATLDHIMPACAPNTWKVVCAVLRKTRGWQREEDRISLSQLRALTGIKNQSTMVAAIDDAVGAGYIIKTPTPAGSVFALNADYELPASGASTEIGLAASTEIGHTKQSIKQSDDDELSDHHHHKEGGLGGTAPRKANGPARFGKLSPAAYYRLTGLVAEKVVREVCEQLDDDTANAIARWSIDTPPAQSGPYAGQGIAGLLAWRLRERVRLGEGFAIPGKYFYSPCETCGKYGGHVPGCRLQYTSGEFADIIQR